MSRIKLLACLLIATASMPIKEASAALVSHWRFDESSGLTASDANGMFPGTLSGGSTWMPAAGKSGGALSFAAATNSFVSMGTGFPSFGGHDFTLALWIKTSDPSNWVVAGRHFTGFFNGYLIAGNSGAGYGAPNKVWSYTGSAPSNSPVSSTSVLDNVWHHVVNVRKGGTGYIYVDGVAENSTSAGSSPFANVPFMIGGAAVGGNPTGAYTGLVDEAMVFSHAVCPDVLAFLANNPDNSMATDAAFEGNVTLEDWTQVADGMTASVKVVDCYGAVQESKNVVLGAGGHLSTTFKVKGPYVVKVKVGHWLTKGTNAVLKKTGSTGNAWTLVNGDIDEDDVVSLLDYDKFSAYFDKTSSDGDWNTPDGDGVRPADADLDGDGFVSLLDYDIFSKNFDKTGD